MDWPWDRDKRKPEEAPRAAKVKSQIADSMKLKSRNGAKIPMKRLKPISDIIRKPNGEVNESAVKNLIHSLEGMLHKK